jgi:inositol-phosphate phosphatase / L-galactose 1-phosphate phosphatase / histidinol-phosphatase
MTEVDAFVGLAERLAAAVRPLVMGYFRSGVAIDDKADTTPVTAADREAEAAMRKMIGDAFPDHGILGEEHGAERVDAAYVWVLDPIDGTKSFVTGKPLFGTLIALLREGTPIVGVIDMPALDERWIGVDRRPTTFNGRPARVRPCPDLGRAWLYASSPHMFPGADAEAFERLRLKSRAAIYGADCYAYGLLASGTVDLVCEATTQPHDYCALVPVVTGAGGVISDWHGRPLGLESDGRVLAAGDESMHATAREVLAG